MKKIIAAAAGLMLVGSALATTASAEISFQGDARARYVYEDNHAFDAGTNAGVTEENQVADYFNTRVRLQITGKTAGGARAVVKLIAEDSAWGDAAGSFDGGNTNVQAYEAYLGLPVGCVDVTIGKQNLSVMPGWWYDVDVTNLRATYVQDNTTIVGFYAVASNDRNGWYNVSGDVKDREDRVWGLAWIQGWGDWTTTLATTLIDNDIIDLPAQTNPAEDDQLGLLAGLRVQGPVGPVTLDTFIGYAQDGYAATDEAGAGFNGTVPGTTGDNGFGGYLSAGMDFDAFGAELLGGFASDGYLFDDSVGFVMMGNGNFIGPDATNQFGALNGELVDTYFVGVKTTYQAVEDLAIGFNLAYANFDAIGTGVTLEDSTDNDSDAFEVSATATYQVVDGATLTAALGYLDIDAYDDAAMGAGLELAISF